MIDLEQPSPQWQTVARLPELYDPQANTWTNMAPHAIERGYHSTALLLPDARVIISGGEGQGGPGLFGESPDYEIWSPPDLFRTARPVISSLPSMAEYGNAITMTYTSSVPRSHVVIHRGGSQTHAFTYNQISHPVSFEAQTGSTLRFTIPANPNLLPPSYYVVFLMSADDVPSVARWIQIGEGLSGIFPDGLESGDTSGWTTVVPPPSAAP